VSRLNDASHLHVYLAAAVVARCRWQCVVALSGEYDVIPGLSSALMSGLHGLLLVVDS